jgi:hypothetical protein
VKAVALALLGVAACGPGTGHGRGTSRGSSAEAALDDVPLCGFHVTVETSRRVPLLRDDDVEGELIAVEPETIAVLAPEGLTRIPRDAVQRVVVTVLPERRTAAGATMGLGALSTLSHGAYLLISLPVWLVAGGIAVGMTSHEERWKFSPMDELYQFARFPQGLPQGWPPANSLPKPCPAPPSGSAPADPGKGSS